MRKLSYLRSSMIKTSDNKSMELMSRKILGLTRKFNKLMRSQNTKSTYPNEQNSSITEGFVEEKNEKKKPLKIWNSNASSIPNLDTNRSTVSKLFEEPTQKTRNIQPLSSDEERNLKYKSSDSARTDPIKHYLPNSRTLSQQKTFRNSSGHLRKGLQAYVIQLRKCDALKGEIEIYDQKKKYAPNRTFDPAKEVPLSSFTRESKSPSRYIPSYSYSKSNILVKSPKLSGFKSTHNLQEDEETTPIYISPVLKKKKMIKSNSAISVIDLKPSYNPILNKISSGRNNKTDDTSPFVTSLKTKGVKLNLSSMNILKEERKNQPFIKQIGLLHATACAENLRLMKSLDQNNLKARIADLGTHEKEPRDYRELYKSLRLGEIEDTEVKEDEIISKIAGKFLGRCKDDYAKKILNSVFSQIEFEDRLFSTINSEQNMYSQTKMFLLALEKSFKNVGIESMLMENKIQTRNKIEPEDESKKITQVIANINVKKWENTQDLQDLVYKKRIMQNVKPLIYAKMKVIKLDKTRRKAKTDSCLNKKY